ncbi:hypothetical protein HYV86_05235 [Candidatus Woesearchaeota archaeon]|nr:hypothetical protein [Candidatus Woesearchaeota archaeon]
MSKIKPTTTRSKKNSETELLATLMELQRRNLVLSEWAQENTLKQRAIQMQEEVEELLTEINRAQPNTQRIKDELGDVLWDCLGTISRAEHEGLFKMQEVLAHIHTKFAERKPFLIENRKVSREEESRVWHEAKAKQKLEQGE